MKIFTLRICLLIISVFLLTGILSAQSTGIQLPTAADTNSSFRVLNSDGTTLLRLNADGGFYFGGATMTGMIPVTGGGTRLMWYPGKAAFRVGVAGGITGEDVNIGLYSIAMGSYTVARGESSTAMGYSTTADGDFSTALGQVTKASGNYSTAMGAYTNANGLISTAIGWNTTASGNFSTAMGSYVKADNMGSFIIGDASNTSSQDSSTANNQMTMRFAGGYRIFSNVSLTTGVYMNAGESGWTNYCDRDKKENFRSIDGELILNKIRSIPITEWNYKGTDPNVKYVGPVAQDFYAAFHLGGTDSLGINSICIDGINMAAVQALEKRTSELSSTKYQLNETMNKLDLANEKIASMEKRLEQLERVIASTAIKNMEINISGK